MPTYAYKCSDCGTKYEHFFKVKEAKEDLLCPSCQSNNAIRMVTAANIGTFSSSASIPAMPACASGQCSGASCPFS